MELTKDLLNDLFWYQNGNLFWKKLGSGKRSNGLAGTVWQSQYICIQINKKIYKAHRLIFLMHYGWLPDQIDHIDGNGLNNKIENLRAASPLENSRNQKIRKDSGSKVKNVRWDKRKLKWQVRLRFLGKEKHIGYFDDIEVANQVAIKARNEHFGQFASHRQ